MKKKTVACLFVCAIVCTLGLCASTRTQTVLASVTGRVLDPNAAVIIEATVAAKNVDTGIETTVQTNEDGIYHFADLGPGNYEVSVSKRGFKVIVKPGVTLHVADMVSMNFTMRVGDAKETVVVEAGAPLINTESAAVSTVVDRQFAEDLPLNGRSFQTLIQLTPGVVLTGYDNHDNGQFSVNGQRAASNYWMVDGVSANVGIGTDLFSTGNGLSGAAASFSVLGGTNSLVSVDAMQEFRIQTSTYAPEFGRTPGGQISIVTRSGTNQFHGTLFDYFRNDVLDANLWFANRDKLPKPQERQNDFGGTIAGPIRKDRTFFFFSYEGLRLRLPQVVESNVPDLQARQNAVSQMQPFLNAFPLPTPSAPDDVINGLGKFNSSFSNRATLDAYSLRIDHKLNTRLSLFARYNRSPSENIERGAGGDSLSVVTPFRITTETATGGATWTLAPTVLNDLRFNYSRTRSQSHSFLDAFGGAVPLTSLPFPSSFAKNGELFFIISPLGVLEVGPKGDNLQRQINLVDNLAVQKGSHSLKLGIDYRRLTPHVGVRPYEQEPLFLSVSSAEAGSPLFTFISSGRDASLLFQNLGVFAQDTWHIRPCFTMTYGLRWDLDFAPSSSPGLLAVTDFNLRDLSQLALAPTGTPPFRTSYGNVAPRLGAAYQFHQSQNWQTVLRGGFGVFFDLATSEVGNSIIPTSYPFGSFLPLFGTTFPVDPTMAIPPPISPANLATTDTLSAFDPHLKLPYTLQWNIALEQALGPEQTISASYVGSSGRRLIQTAIVTIPNPNLAGAELVANSATSDYHALQVQFQRRLSRGFQAIASYTWSHSIDSASAGSIYGNTENALLPGTNNSNRASSDFDIRNSFSMGMTYEIPSPKINALGSAILRGWSVQSTIQARSAPPETVFVSSPGFNLLNDYVEIRPDVTPGIPLYLYGNQYPGGKVLNNSIDPSRPGCLGPFCPPPTDSSGTALRQGTLSRNVLRAFGAAQWDFALHRDFPIRESCKLQFRAEMFNVLNHPNFGPPVADMSNASQFGQSITMLGQSLAGSNLGSGGFNPLYQIGGPRSIQFALKLTF
jgi:hypothetical protein